MGQLNNESSFFDFVSILMFFLLIFFIFKMIYNEKRLENFVDELSQNNLELHEKNLSQEEDLLYFNSPQYRDLYAKENLNLLKP